MYLTNAFLRNNGSFETLSLDMQFFPDGRPKPTVFVGTNGAGKTGLLSTVADGLIEIAAMHYNNVTPALGAGRKFFRLIGNRTQRIGTGYEVSALKFKHEATDFIYKAKTGTIPDEFALPAIFGSITDGGTDFAKHVMGPADKVSGIFGSGTYTFFPSSRFETPHWVNSELLDRKVEGDFSLEFNNQLSKPIVIQSAIQLLKPWLLSLIIDMLAPFAALFRDRSVDLVDKIISSNMSYMNTFIGMNSILSCIMRKPGVSFKYLNRAYGDARITIMDGNAILVNSIDGLSSGQSTLLAIFGTLVRYGDKGIISQALNNIEGIVIVDEIDAHLHSDLQYDALPDLIKMFPKVQFIVTSHSPLLPLGMRKTFGDDGFSLVDLPSGLTIDPERYSEFTNSYSYFRATQTFEAGVRAKLSEGQHPIILCEGETDPKYFQTALDLLGYIGLPSNLEFDWIGQKSVQGARGSGKEALISGFRFLANNPGFVHRQIVFLFDNDVSRQPETLGDVHLLVIPANPENDIRKTGIENLLPKSVFESRFFRVEHFNSGSDPATANRLQKVPLCNYLCDERRSEEDFAGFRPTLDLVRDALARPRIT